MTVTDQEINDQLQVNVGEPTELLPDGGAPAGLPEQWRPIAGASEASTRRDIALGLWNDEFLAMVPRTAQLLRTELVDVRVAHRGDEHVLVYVVEHHAGTPQREVRTWVGGTPDSTAELPELWDAVPGPLQEFLLAVHGGFTAADREAFGPQAPRYLGTVAENAGDPDGIEGWEYQPDSTRLLVIATDGGVDCCVSPDLPGGQGVLVYQGDEPDPAQPIGELLDEIIHATL